MLEFLGFWDAPVLERSRLRSCERHVRCTRPASHTDRASARFSSRSARSLDRPVRPLRAAPRS